MVRLEKKGIEKEITVKNLFDYLEAQNLPYETVVNIDAMYLAQELGLFYPYQPQIMGPVKYTGNFEGDDITCFITIGGDLAVWAVYGTIDDGFCANDVIPSYDLADKCVRVK